MEAQHPAHQRAGLQGVALDELQALVQRVVRPVGGFDGLGQRVDAGQDVPEIVRHAHGQRGEGVPPGRRTEASLRDGLPRDVHPGPLEAQQQAALGPEGLAVLEDVGHAPGAGMADAEVGAEAALAAERAPDVALHLGEVALVDGIPEDVGPVEELRERNPGQLLQPRAGVVEGHVAALVEDHPRPAPHEVVDLRLGLEQPEPQLLGGFVAGPGLGPGILLETRQRRHDGLDVDEESSRGAAPREAHPPVGVVGMTGEILGAEFLVRSKPGARRGLPLGAPMGQDLQPRPADEGFRGLPEPAGQGVIGRQETPRAIQHGQSPGQPVGSGPVGRGFGHRFHRESHRTAG